MRFLSPIPILGTAVPLLLLAAAPAEGQSGSPRALVDDLRIERYGDAPAHAVRMQFDPHSGSFLCITLEGDVYVLPRERPDDRRLLATAADHGIERLQGLTLSADGTVYLVGNVATNEGKGTKGRGVRGRSNGPGEMEWSVVFETEEFGTVATAFDHGFTAVRLSPDGRDLLFTSGARTDHGEVQDNLGAYPGSRDEPLTAAILRVPADASDLFLPNDLEALNAGRYIYARGIRSAFDIGYNQRGHLFAVSNSGDYDHPEDMFWVREGHHYGFPWVMGGVENPQQYPDFRPDPDRDPFLNRYSHALSYGYFSNDSDFPQRPADLVITPSIPNVGPDANYYRDPATGAVEKGDETGVAVTTFTAHRSLLGLTFDVDSTLAKPYRGDGLVLGWTDGKQSVLMSRLSDLGSDLLHLQLFFDASADGYIVSTKRLAEGFRGPVDADLVDGELFILEYGGSDAAIWRITFADPPITTLSPNQD